MFKINLQFINVMKDSIFKLLIGSTGIGLTEVVASAPTFDPTIVTETANILVQIVIAIVTLFGLFKKKKVTKTIK